MSSPPTGQQLTQYLVENGQIKPAEVDKARQLAQENMRGIGLTLAQVGLVSERDLAAAYSSVLERPLLEDALIPANVLPNLTLKESFLRSSHILPISCSERRIEVATADPENQFALDALAMATGYRVSLTIATVTQIDQALDRWYGAGEAVEESSAEILDLKSVDDSEAIDRLRDLASQAPVVRLVNSLIRKAVEAGASDIHIEPFNAELRIRYRIDGLLQTVEAASARYGDAIVSRIKLMARMNIAERRLPQDGGVHLRIQGIDIDLRVSTIPTIEGESVVLRILDKNRARLDLDALGFDADLRVRLGALMQRPNGIVLVTGPTGSGKTTTLYTLLKRVNSDERKLVTIEDPVEYQLDGINQIQVKPQIGLDFAHALRSIVRQDPDVIMVGEMRDLETARIAVQSALTGHLVLSTLHTNDAGSTITRLLDMGVENYLITSAVNAILAQRLIRVLCQKCSEPFEPSLSLITELNLESLSDSDRIQLHRAKGCAECEHTGYRGRTVIGELLVLSDEIRQAILTGDDSKQIQHTACDGGMIPMKLDGLRKALRGETTIEEITRVTQTE